MTNSGYSSCFFRGKFPFLFSLDVPNQQDGVDVFLNYVERRPVGASAASGRCLAFARYTALLSFTYNHNNLPVSMELPCDGYHSNGVRYLTCKGLYKVPYSLDENEMTLVQGCTKICSEYRQEDGESIQLLEREGEEKAKINFKQVGLGVSKKHRKSALKLFAIRHKQ